VPPRGLEPTGIFLVDKPAGRSSFAIVAEVRSRTGARTGHAGTLDPFATGLLVLLSGRATKVASCFVGLDKRYLTDVDLTARTTTGDPEGEELERHPAPDAAELERRLAGLRGEIELPIPAASAVKIGGERAYRLHRRGVAVEMPLRRSRVDALDVITYQDGVARLDLHVSSGTYVRAIADALGGHCRTLRRTEVGPFAVEEADPDRVIPVDDALARLPEQVPAE
jgi:tRNA pseudouridine55 synthase